MKISRKQSAKLVMDSPLERLPKWMMIYYHRRLHHMIELFTVWTYCNASIKHTLRMLYCMRFRYIHVPLSSLDNQVCFRSECHWCIYFFPAACSPLWSVIIKQWLIMHGYLNKAWKWSFSNYGLLHCLHLMYGGKGGSFLHWDNENFAVHTPGHLAGNLRNKACNTP